MVAVNELHFAEDWAALVVAAAEAAVVERTEVVRHFHLQLSLHLVQFVLAVAAQLTLGSLSKRPTRLLDVSDQGKRLVDTREDVEVHNLLMVLAIRIRLTKLRLHDRT